MKNFNGGNNNQMRLILLVIVITSILSGCSRSPSRPLATDRLPPVQREDPVTDTGRPAAVLSLHQYRQVNEVCRYGLTLTNNLTTEIRDLSLHFTAYNETGTRLHSVTRGFQGVHPTQGQFAEIRFPFECRQIQRIEVGAFGRCMVGELTRRSSQAVSCLEIVDIPQSRFVELIKAEEG